MIIKKPYVNGHAKREVVFILSPETAEFATTANIVGEFNNWDIHATPMKRQRDGTFKVSMDLQRNREYQFRYLIDFTKWENDLYADRLTPTPFGNSQNSVIVV